MAQKFLSSSLTRDYQTDINRNVFDVTKKHLASYNFGKIYPIDIVHLQGKETYRVRPSVILDLEALNHELYNDIRCNILYFKVNTRSVWPDFRKFCRQDITKDTKIIHPYISRNNTDWLKIGSLAQHMGVPVVRYSAGTANTMASFTRYPLREGATISVVGSNPYSTPADTWEFNYALRDITNLSFNGISYNRGTTPFFQGHSVPGNASSGLVLTRNSTFWSWANDDTLSQTRIPLLIIGSGLNHQFSIVAPEIRLHHIRDDKSDYTDFIQVTLWAGDDLNNAKAIADVELRYDPTNAYVDDNIWHTINVSSSHPAFYFHNNTLSSGAYITEDYQLYFAKGFAKKIVKAQETYPFVTLSFNPVKYSGNDYTHCMSSNGFPSDFIHNGNNVTIRAGFYGNAVYSSVTEVNEGEVSRYSGEHPVLPLSALPFRVYRSIYNSHFRDRIHDPLRDNQGNIMVDQYCEEIGSGPDTITKLDFEYARYDDDLFNTCIASPTMGDDVNRPLVGITTGNDPNSFVLNYTANGDAYSIDVKTHTNSAGQDQIDSVDTATNSAHANDLTYLTIKDAIQYGISLQDLKDKQALTRWYESSYRGNARFTYNDFIKAHFGEEPSLRENLEAECLGGETFHVNTAAVLNTSDVSNSDSPLGHKAGIAQFKGTSPEISVYADEDCYIMGVMWFSVDNLNVQSIDKFWLYQQPLDYADPAFADLGVEPILMKQVAPLQTAPEHLNDVFGYQRIYGDKIFSFDTVAGDFTDDKSDYLMIRKFLDQPSLTADYNKMRPEELTNVFAFDNTKDKIYGRLFFEKQITTYLSQRPNASII